MLELKRIQENPAELEEMLKKRHSDPKHVAELKSLIERTKEVKSEIDSRRSLRNSASKEIGILIGAGKKDEAENKKAEVKSVGEEITEFEKQHQDLESKLNDILLGLPNYLDPEVPDGYDENDNVIVREVGKIPEFDFEPIPHYEIGEKLGILDFEGGVKLSGSRFYAYRGLAAKLERAIINFMLDLQTEEHGYEETWVPLLVNDACMTTTGQFPKFMGEYYRLDRDELSLIPTSEVPLVNLYQNDIIPGDQLPVKITAATSCFRREAGAAGKDTRGLIRVHQFQKVELVQIVHPDESRKAHETMVTHAEAVLKRLNIPYRVVLLCSGDIGATATKTYDIEVWLPGMNRYMEISSISNCLDYQARRGMIRIRPKPEEKPIYAHTLNGSGLAAGRTLIAVIENYQKADGSFDIPEALKKYM